ncbi:hypothetical protein [Novipirellula caenicola]|uniref:Uncharacterized protein n=1 Tax=Novipirellula caenicola TaxID=1536901 RepID=A0ABP9VY63_9BACT
MIELIAGLVGLMLFGGFLLVLGIVGFAIAQKVRKGSIVPKSTKRAVDEKVETVYRDKQVREVLMELARAEGYELEG